MTNENKPKIDYLANLPLSFEQNIGQNEEKVKFLTRGTGYTALISETEVVFALKYIDNESNNSEEVKIPGYPKMLQQIQKQNYQISLLKMKIEGGNSDIQILGEYKLDGKINYLKGNDGEKWITDVPIYKKVRCIEIYPGIDLVYYGDSKNLEYDYILKPGANPNLIIFSFEDAEKIEINEKGNLLVSTKAGILTLLKPNVLQSLNGVEQEIECAYKVSEDNKVQIILADYDVNEPLTIDPKLSYSTFLGGSFYDSGFGIAVDSRKNVYVTGITTSNINGDVFVTKLNANGTEIVYSSYFGGSGYDVGQGIVVDADGNAYVTGYTDSNNFPSINEYNGGASDAFVTKLNAAGNGLVYSTYLGGSDYDYGYGIAVDSSGNAYVAGLTHSNTNDGFVSKIAFNGSILSIDSTIIGGSGSDFCTRIAVGGGGDVYVTGATNSSDFDGLRYHGVALNNDISHVFVKKITFYGTMSTTLYSIVIGGESEDVGNGIAVDSSGCAYVTGYTSSNTFPTTSNDFDKNYNGSRDAFVTKINPYGTDLIYSTFLGGSNYDEGGGIVVDGVGNAYITGYTMSSNFPTTDGAYDKILNGGSDAFVTALNPEGTALLYSTFLGGDSNEFGNGIAVDNIGDAYVTGVTYSNNFPTTSGAYDTGFNGVSDAFVTKFRFSNNPPSVPDYNVTTQENIPVSGGVVGTDTDGDVLTYSKLTDTSHGSASVSTNGSWTYTPNPNYFGNDSFVVKVEDGNGGVNTSTIKITILQVYHQPIGNSATLWAAIYQNYLNRRQ